MGLARAGLAAAGQGAARTGEYNIYYHSSEVTNSFWKYAMHKELSEEQCQKGIDYCLDLIDDFIDTNSMCKEVFSEAVDLEHSAYDLYYLVLARRNNAVLLTRDKKLKVLAYKMKISIG